MDKSINQPRFVLYLDIMGFKERVARNSMEDLLDELSAFNKKITDIINSVNKTADNGEGIITDDSSEAQSSSDIVTDDQRATIECVQFSDSIILFSKSNSENDLVAITNAAKEIMFTAITMDKPIPLKGSLAEGDVVSDLSKQLFFGQALIDAFILEEDVQCYGIVVHHTAEGSVKRMKHSEYRDVKVPFKNGGFIQHYELPWYKGRTEDTLKALELFRLNVSNYPRKYIDHTKELIASYQAEAGEN